MNTIISFVDMLFVLTYLGIGATIGYFKYKDPKIYMTAEIKAPVKIFFLDSFFYLVIALAFLIILDIIAHLFKFISKSKEDSSDF